MFERFTEMARQVVVRAQEESRDLRHLHIGTEHLLLGLLRQREAAGARALELMGVDLVAVRLDVAELAGHGAMGLGQRDAEALEAIGIDLHEVRRRAEDAFGPGALEFGYGRVDRHRCSRRPGSRASGHLRFTPRAKRSLVLALREAKALRHTYIGTEHVLLGIVRADGIGSEILARRGASSSDVRRAVAVELARGGDAPRRSA